MSTESAKESLGPVSTEVPEPEKALRNSELLLHAVLEQMPSGVTIRDARSGALVLSNARSREIMGDLASVAAQFGNYHGLHPDGRPYQPEEWPVFRSMSTGEVVLGEEVECERNDGTRICLSINSAPVRAADGQIVLGVKVFHDITEHKRAKKALLHMNEILEKSLRERTADLIAANCKLEERAQQLRQLAGELTLTEQRERRNLSGILHDGLQQYLVAAKMQVSELIHAARGNAAKQIALAVESLLSESINVSRSLAAELSPPILQDGGILAGLRWLSRWMANKQGLNVDLTSEVDSLVLSEDVKVLLFQSVRELLLNVVKHAQVNSAKVHLHQDADSHLRITVSDTGKGFDPLEVETRSQGIGGFGLFSIRERIGLVGGRVDIDSAPDHGARLTLIVPFSAGEAVQPALSLLSKDGSGPVASVPPQPGGKIRILLTEDHAVVREGLARLLDMEADFEVVGQAEDGQRAIEMADALHPDIILMDISMPRMNGIDATRVLARRHPAVNVIGLSFYTEDEQAREMLEAGAKLYMSKTGPPAELKKAIRSCMADKSGKVKAAA